ncbi:cobalamin B12-binding domain-containing protein [Streptomyces sp. NPDC090025]|uniref:cobalamin B12-binding domain-containing protein n=1 Tax=Streptomyces sp. NPDC090025 TaxID=3365922 RepID=UPI00383484B0
MRVLISSVSSDSHTWNLVYLQLLLEERGHHAVNLGSCVPKELLVEAALTERPDLIVISSVNGHGHQQGGACVRALRQFPQLREVPVVIGGKLGTLGADNSRFVAGLLAEGFAGVFTGDDAIPEFLAYLERLAATTELVA